MLIYQRFFVRHTAKPAMDERARDWLRAVYDDDVSATERLLRRRLPELRSSWGVSGDDEDPGRWPVRGRLDARGIRAVRAETSPAQRRVYKATLNRIAKTEIPDKFGSPLERLPSRAGAEASYLRFPRDFVTRLSVLILAAAMVAGVGLRVVRLDQSPPGFMQDEACNGYDAYCILKTGRDQHGNFLPLTMQAFNDYRMPLFDYSLVPFVAAFGLNPAGVRLCAATWGVVDMAAIATIAGLMLGWPGAAIAALLVAFSPWHLHFSRFAIEGTAASATVDLAMAFFFLWLTRRRNRWLLLSGLFFGLSLYSYSITKLFVPLMIGWLALFYWRDLMRSARAAAAAIVS